MKVSLNWAQDYSNVDIASIDKDELLKKIDQQLGAIDEVVNWGQRYDGVLVAKVMSCEKHANADKLSVCLIDDGGVSKNIKRGKDGYVQVVCGAPNVRATQLVAWIGPGVVVPSSYDKEQLVLDAREIRGTISNGMIASPSELGISGDHDGILVIDPMDASQFKAKPGTAFKRLYGLDDTVVDIENKMFSHRPDCFGILGVAREIAGITHQAFKSPNWYNEDAKITPGRPSLPLDIKNGAGKLVPRFSAVVIEAVELRPSPYGLQAALTRVGIKPVNNVVDVTNFVMHLSGQPLHAYDYDKVRGAKSGASLAIRLSKKGEELDLLGGKKLKLDSGSVVITDGSKPIGLGGVMGGSETEIGVTTKNIILECANFDMNLTRKTAMTYGLFTDAVTRFSKGQSPRQTMAVLAYAVSLINEYASGQVAGKVIDVVSQKATLAQVDIDHPRFVGDRLGLPGISLHTIKHLLSNTEFKFGDALDKGLLIEAPFWRTDINIAEDIVEEVGRLYGYNRLPHELPQRTIEPVKKDSKLELKAKLREVLSSFGANEALTYSFVHGSLLEASGQNLRRAYHLRNALSPELQYYRTSIIPSLLEKIHPNVKQGFKNFAVFEIGTAHSKDFVDENKLPQELNRLAFVITKADGSGAPYYWAKHYLEQLLGKFSITDLDYLPLPEPKTQTGSIGAFEPIRTAFVKSGGQDLAVLGEPSLKIRAALKLPEGTSMFELDLDVLLKLIGSPSYTALNRFPSLDQDLCLAASTDLSYLEITSFVKNFLDKSSASHGYDYNLRPLDIFQKDSDKDRKQTTWRISLQHPDRTLTSAEANKLLDDLAGAAKIKLKAERI